MRIAYLILAHNNPRHLQRLIRTLSSDSSTFFIHIDRKSSLEPFLTIGGEKVHLSQERIPVYWGDYSQVEAILILLRQALASQHHFDYFVLLSGADYPIQPVSHIESFFEANKGKEFINIVEMPSEAARKSISRLTTFKPSPGESLVAKVVRKLLVTIGVIPRERDYKSHLRNLVPYAGSTWWALSRETSEYVLNFVDRERKVVNFFRNTVCPDESFFQTVIGNSPYKTRTRRNLTYTDWSAGGPNPASLTETHIDLLTATASISATDVYGPGELLFARKFSDEAEEIVLRLDRVISEKAQAAVVSAVA